MVSGWVASAEKNLTSSRTSGLGRSLNGSGAVCLAAGNQRDVELPARKLCGQRTAKTLTGADNCAYGSRHRSITHIRWFSTEINTLWRTTSTIH